MANANVNECVLSEDNNRILNNTGRLGSDSGSENGSDSDVDDSYTVGPYLHEPDASDEELERGERPSSCHTRKSRLETNELENW